MELIPDEAPVFCYHTGRDLFQEIDGKTVWLAPHGMCDICDQWFHYKALHTPAGKSAPGWNIRYLGYTCKPCFKELMGK